MLNAQQMIPIFIRRKNIINFKGPGETTLWLNADCMKGFEIHAVTQGTQI